MRFSKGTARCHGAKLGDKVRFIPVQRQMGWLQRRLSRGLNAGIGYEAWAGELISALEERALWFSFGL